MCWCGPCKSYDYKETLALKPFEQPAKPSQPLKGWVFYDEDCPFCVSLIHRFRALFQSVQFQPMPLQSEWARQQLGYSQNSDQDALLAEMKVLTANQQVYGGSEAVIYLARQFWWALPMVALTFIPGIRPVLDQGYKAIARRRHCSSSGSCQVKRPPH